MTEFDLDRYLRASRKVDLEGVAWDRIPDHPFPPEEARCLAYMMDIESHTVIYLRDLLATRAALEPDITAFLSGWVYEELWHGEAFSRFLGEAGYAYPPTGSVPGATAGIHRAWRAIRGSAGRSVGRAMRATSRPWSDPRSSTTSPRST